VGAAKAGATKAGATKAGATKAGATKAGATKAGSAKAGATKAAKAGAAKAGATKAAKAGATKAAKAGAAVTDSSSLGSLFEKVCELVTVAAVPCHVVDRIHGQLLVHRPDGGKPLFFEVRLERAQLEPPQQHRQLLGVLGHHRRVHLAERLGQVLERFARCGPATPALGGQVFEQLEPLFRVQEDGKQVNACGER
jgi:hypothetical protein